MRYVLVVARVWHRAGYTPQHPQWSRDSTSVAWGACEDQGINLNAKIISKCPPARRHHDMETFSSLLAFVRGFPAQCEYMILMVCFCVTLKAFEQTSYTADVLVLYVTRSSAAIKSTISLKWVIAFLGEGFQLPAPSKEITENVNMLMFSLNKICQ